MSGVSSTSSPPPIRTNLWRSETRRDQLFFLSLALVLLALSCVMQNVMKSRRTDWNLVRADTPEAEKSLSSLAINFPRLTMGGFRGILSTYLWQQAEDDKGEHRWVELETKYDVIAALQPYFASVYIFHSWNQAYNLSAQWQENDTKYKWVLDGLAYLYKGEDYNPGNSDLYKEEGDLYFLKLGGSYERIFFREHWRADIARLHELNTNKQASNNATVALGHVRDFVNHRDSRISGEEGNYLHLTELPDPDKREPGAGWGVSISAPTDRSTNFNLFSDRTDGKKPGEPMEFRYGLSPFYFAYCEYLRCMASGGPISSSVQIYDAWPGMSLRMWCRDDVYYSYDAMNALFGPTPDEKLLKNHDLFNAKVDEIHQCYRNVQMIGPRAIDLLQAHIGRYKEDLFKNGSHILETQCYIAIGKAESRLFDALVQWQVSDRKLTDPVRQRFQEAAVLYDDAYTTEMQWVDLVYPQIEGQPPNPNRPDAEQYALALQARKKGIADFLNVAPNEKPDLSFFHDEVVEK